MNNERNFSFVVKVKNEDGTIDVYNESNPARGYKQSWFKTPKSAMKKCKNILTMQKLTDAK